SGMFGGHPNGDMILTTRELLQIGMVTAGVIAMHWTMRDESFETTVMRLPAWAITAVGSVMAFAIIFTQETSNAFIFFQFWGTTPVATAVFPQPFAGEKNSRRPAA